MINLDILELQLPETLASTVGGEGFWELQSKNTGVIQCWEPQKQRRTEADRRSTIFPLQTFLDGVLNPHGTRVGLFLSFSFSESNLIDLFHWILILLLCCDFI